MYVCVFVYGCVYTHAYVYAPLRVHIYAWVCARACVCVCGVARHGLFSFGNGGLLQSDARILVGLGLGGMNVLLTHLF